MRKREHLMSLAIETRQLSVNYQGHAALMQLDLCVERGEVFGFLGHNGAGKTTTLNVLTTLLAPTSGQAFVSGHDVVKDATEARRAIGYVPENVRLYDNLSALDNLRYLAKLSGVRQPDAPVKAALEFVEASDLAHRLVGTMSKGQRQRIGLAQAIVHRPEVLFLDEPTSGLDPAGIKNLRDLIMRINSTWGTTVFMNTHLISEVSKTCTAIAILNHGELVLSDRFEHVMQRFGSDEELENVYLSLVPGASNEAMA